MMDLEDLIMKLLLGGCMLLLAILLFATTAEHSTVKARRAICSGSDGVLVEGTHCLLLPTNNLIDLRGRQDD
jgi:hypothetical protein